MQRNTALEDSPEPVEMSRLFLARAAAPITNMLIR
jgi:hypothetical protein